MPYSVFVCPHHNTPTQKKQIQYALFKCEIKALQFNEAKRNSQFCFYYVNL